MVRLVGVEPTTNGFEVRYSIQLSYRRISALCYSTKMIIKPVALLFFISFYYDIRLNTAKNSLLPSEPSIGESVIPTKVKPSATIALVTFSVTFS